MNLPGEASSAVTCIDGYQMARKGRAGAALAIAALGSFFAGCVGTLLLASFALPMTELALKFGPAEYFSLMILGLIGAVVLAHGSLLKAIAMIVLGLLLGIIGTDVNSGLARFSFGIPELTDGIGTAVVAMGLFGFAEILVNLEHKSDRELLTQQAEVADAEPRGNPARDCPPCCAERRSARCSASCLAGVRCSRRSPPMASRRRCRSVRASSVRAWSEGVAAPESANNAAAQTSFIPLLTLGIPPNAVMALMVGAMTIHNIQPGPQVMTSNPALFWGLIASMWVGNLMLVVLNLPLIGMWIRLLTVPYRLLYPAILLFCCIGVYSLSNSTFDVYVTAVFGLLGYVFAKLECEPAPLILGFVLGPLMEENLRRAMLLSRGDPTVFATRPLSLVMLLVAAGLLLLIVAPNIRKKRADVFVEET